MKRASKLLSDHEKTRIERAVAEAEAKTSAEILPVVASDSGRYDRAEDVAGVWIGLIAMSVVWLVLQLEGAKVAMWGAAWSRFELPILLGVVVLGFLLGAAIASRSWTVRRLFTPGGQMRREVERRAAEAFFDQRVHHTEDATGLLIYVSLFERRAEIRADRAVFDKLGQEALDGLRDKLIEGILAGDLATSLCETIKAAGERLAEALPRGESDRDEIDNALVILD